MKIVWAALLACIPSLASAQALPDRILVLTRPSSEFIDGIKAEFLQDLDLQGSAAGQQIMCLRTHGPFCDSTYVDIAASPKMGVPAEVLDSLKALNLCSLNPRDMQAAFAKSRSTGSAAGEIGATVVAQCGPSRIVLEVPDEANIDEKRLRHASKRAAQLFAFVLLWTKDHRHSENTCPKEWKESAGRYIPGLLDDIHLAVLKQSSSLPSLRENRIGRPPSAAYSLDVTIDRSFVEKFADPVPTFGDTRNKHDIAIDMVAIVDGATGKVAGLDKADLTPEQAALFPDIKHSAASWLFRPNIPIRVPFHVEFHCKQ